MMLLAHVRTQHFFLHLDLERWPFQRRAKVRFNYHDQTDGQRDVWQGDVAHAALQQANDYLALQLMVGETRH